MTKSFWRKVAGLPVVAAFLAGSLAVAAPQCETGEVTAASYTRDFPREASELLKEVRTLAGKLERDTATLKTFTRHNQVSWQSHSRQLNQMREDINAMGRSLCRLHVIQHVTTPWQQEALDRIQPAALELASRTEAAIEHLNDNPGYLFAPSYREHVAAMADQAEVIQEQAGGFLTYGDALERVDRLQQKLGMTAS